MNITHDQNQLNEVIQQKNTSVAKHIIKRVKECLTHAREKELNGTQLIDLVEFELEKIAEEARGLND